VDIWISAFVSLKEATMAAETFGKLLDKLGVADDADAYRPSGPLSRVSAGVGLAVLTLALQQEATSARRRRQYGDAVDDSPAAPQLRLADLAGRIAMPPL
jgi:hypothetical protein